MASKRNELKAGAFIIITLLLAILVIIKIRGANLGPAQVRTVSFKLTDDLGGLQIGDDVRLGGFKVGVVQEIQPANLQSADPKVLVTITLPGSYTLHTNAIVAIQNGITGSTNLNIQSVGSGPPLADGAMLVGVPDPKTALFASLGRAGPHIESAVAQLDTETVPKVNQTVDGAKTLLAHVDAKVDPVVVRYDKVADNTSAAMGQINDLLGDTKPDIRGTMKNLNGATGTLKEKLPGLIDQITGAIKKVDASLTTAQAALLDVQKTAANAKDLTGSLRTVVVENHGKLDGIISGIKATSDNLKEASIEIRHSPWRLLYKPTPEEAANLNLYDSAREFADGAGSLSDAATALRDAMHDPNADRAQIQKLVEGLNASFAHFQQVENKLWTTARP
jgi:ABC-type transporter Mla subunit MlaD